MNKRLTLGGGALVALALLAVGLTILFGHVLRGWRIDLTQNHIYTTAPGTNHILKGLKEPINLYFFYSPGAADQFPQIKAYAGHVRELLEELAARSSGKLRLHVIDPQPFSEDEDRASELGVRAVPVGAAGTSLYFGLAGTNSTDGHAAIQFFDPSKEEFLEYDVMKVVYQLANTKKPVVAWLSNLPMSGGFDPSSGQPREPWVVYEQAQQLFDVRPLDANITRIDPDVDVLVLVHPKQLTPAAQYAIDQYALRGGHILAFVDPLAEQDTSGANPQNPIAAMGADRSSHLEPLLSAWGVAFNPRQVIGDADRALSVTMREGQAPARHLGILGLDESSFNHKDVITSGLSNINVATAGYLQPKKGSGVSFEPLVESSDQAEPMPVERFAMLFDPASLLDGFKPTGQHYTLAARVIGKVKSAFPSGPPSGVQPPAGSAPLKASIKPLDLIVVADTDLLSDFLWVREQSVFGQRIAQPWASNGDFVFNALDNLAGSDDLISVRGRATFSRPFTRVEALRARADERFRAKEQELEAELRQTEDKLTALQAQRNDKSALILSPDQERELQHFQADKLRIRKELRQVRLGLDQDIDRLGTTLKVINIVIVPVLFAVIALLIALRRRRRVAASSADYVGTAGGPGGTEREPDARTASSSKASTVRDEEQAGV
ncbi:MAG TPA: Gldg family protein [Steroidobacteraceae bacterium]|nr:Gldg family protein [Steroidobacteraceae bacterium]